MTSPKDYLTDKEKLMEKIEKMFYTENGFLPEMVTPDLIKEWANKVKALLTSEVENERKRLLKEVKEKVIGKDEVNECYFENPDGSITPDSGYNEAIARNELREEQRKILSDISSK